MKKKKKERKEQHFDLRVLGSRMVSKSRHFNRFDLLIVNQSYHISVSWLTTACACPFPQTSLSSKLATRVAEAGFEIEFDPPADGKCFYYAAFFQIGFSETILTSLIFEYLENHQFDVSR